MKKKKQQKQRKSVLLLVMAILIGTFFITAKSRAAEEEQRVLFISSYSYSWDSVPLQINGLQKSLGEEINLEYAFMDTKAVDDLTSKALFYKTLKYRLSKVEPYDVIIVGDDAALQFAMDYKEELFADTPIVFEGIDDVERALEAAKDTLVTGVVEQIDYSKTIEIAMKINPNATKIAAILDDTLSGKGLQKQFYALKEDYPELSFEEINCSRLSHNQLCDKLMHISEDTILFFLIFTEDAEENMYTTNEGVELIETYTSVPVYRMVQVGIGTGLLGGNIVSHEKMGEIAGQMALDILNGTNPSDIEVVTESPTVYYFDEQVIRQFNINKLLFPSETIFINQEEVKKLELPIQVLVAVGLFLSILIIVLISVFFSRRKHMKKLYHMIEQMDPAYSRDTLTGIRSRMAFIEALQRKIVAATACAVILFDIDDFDKINEELGHSVGDTLLKQVASRLIDLEDGKFKCYRVGGDEFVGILKSGDRNEIDQYVNAIHETSHKPFELDGKEYIVQYSMGIALHPKNGDEVTELVNNAGVAMEQVKKGGKDGFSYYGEMGSWR